MKHPGKKRKATPKATPGQGKGGAKLGPHYAGGPSSVLNPKGKRAKTSTVGNPGGEGFSPKKAFKDAGSTRTAYDKTTPGWGK
jgi:hypothetical protein